MYRLFYPIMRRYASVWSGVSERMNHLRKKRFLKNAAHLFRFLSHAKERLYILSVEVI
jgi:hypothetical protein